MIRYKLTDGTYMDVDPMYEQIFLASNDGAVVATGSDDIMVDNSEAARLAALGGEVLTTEETNIVTPTQEDTNLVYEFRTEGNKGAWGKSTDGGVNFEVVDSGNIPEEWYEDPKFMEVYKKETDITNIEQIKELSKQDSRLLALESIQKVGTPQMKLGAGLAQGAYGFFSNLFSDDVEVEEKDRETESYKKIANTFGDNAMSDFFHGISTIAKRDWEVGKGVQPSINIQEAISQGREYDKDDIIKLAKNAIEVEAIGSTDEQKAYQKVYEENKEKYGGITAWFMGMGAAPEFMMQTSVGSAANMLSSTVHGEDVATRAIAGGTAAAGTALAIGTVAAPVIPEELVTMPTAFMSGVFGTISGSMEQGLTFTELMKESLQVDGKDFTPENIEAFLKNDEIITYKDPRFRALDITGTRAEIISKRAIRRGLAIGFVDFATAGLTKGTVSSMWKKGVATKTTIGTTGTTMAIGGGLASETGGQLAGGQEFDIGEILTEGMAEKAFAMTGVTTIPTLLKKRGKYKINGESFSEKDFLDITSKMDDVDIAMSNIEIENDNTRAAQLKQRQNDAILETQINAKVEDSADRKKLVDLEKQRVKAEADVKKKGIQAVPGAKETLENIEMQMNEIVGKYTAIDGRTKDVRARKKTAQDVRTRLDEISTEAIRVAVAKNTATIKKQMEAIDKKTGRKGQVVEMSSEDIAESQTETIALFEAEINGYKQQLSSVKDKKSKEYTNAKENLDFFQQQLDGIKTADTEFGYIIDRTDGSYDIVLNKDKPMVGTAAHEFQHRILSRTLKNNQDIQDKAGKALTDYVTGKFGGVSPEFINRMSAYINPETGEQVSEFGEEIITVMSESILDGSLKYNENLFTKVGDVIRQTLQRVGAIDIKFDTGRDIYNFIKDYNRSVEKDYVSRSIVRMAVEGAKGRLVEGDVKTAPEMKMSKDASNNVQRIYEEQGEAGAMDIIEQFKPIVNKIVERRSQAPNFDRQLLTDEIETGNRGIFDLIRDYKPESGVPLAAYINKFLPARAIEASKRVLGEEFVEDITERVDIAAEEVAPKVVSKPKPKKIVLADRLNITKEVDAAVAKIVPDLDINKLTFKNLKNKVPSIVGKLFGIAPKKLITNANITKGELQKSQMFINKNADLLIKMLPEGSTEGGMATGVPKTLLNEFYTKGERAKMAKTGTKAGLPIQQKNNIKKSDFLETFGIVDGVPNRTDRNTSARVLSLANTLGKMITNQAVRQQVQTETFRALEDGKSTFMFSKADLAIAKGFKQEDTYYKIDSKEAAERYVKEDVPKLIKVFKDYPGLLNANELVNGLDINTELKEIIRTELRKIPELQVRGKYPKRELSKWINNFFPKGSRLSTGQLTVEKLKKAGESRINEFNKQSGINFDAHWKAIDKALSKDPTLLGPILIYLGNAQNSRTHIQRSGAEFTAYDKTIKGKVYLEHALQNVKAYRTLIEASMNDKTENRDNFKKAFKALKSNYKLIGVSVADNKKLDDSGYKLEMPKNIDGSDWSIFNNNWWDRYINEKVNSLGGINFENFKVIGSKNNLAQELNIPILKLDIKQGFMLSKAMNNSRVVKDAKGISILDFDDTLATTESLVKYTAPDGKLGTLNAEQFASTYEDLQDQGYTFDFSDFNKVVKGKLAPLFNKAIKLQGKFGPENMFVLTARPPQAAQAIYDFLKANDLNIPLKNITGLGNSTSEAKALWIADKVGEGYNDFYFADDALQNVQAVKNMLDQFDVKSKVQQAKVKFSKDMNTEFNSILEEVTGIESKKRFSDIKARKRGESKGKFRFFIPPSHEDFVGLLYNFMGKGKEGNAHRDFFEQALIRPLNRAYRELNTAKQAIANDYKQLNKQFPKVKKKLTKKTPDGDFTYQDAIRVYLWNKHGHTVPGLSPTDQAKLSELIMNDSELQAYAETLSTISKQSEYVKPTDHWEAGDIRMDLDDATGRIGREQFFSEFFENADVIFSQENLNKIEAAYGAGMVSALKDILYRTKTGRNRPSGQNKMVNQFLNYLNGSVASTMFFNIRSAVLQQMSMVNFINYGDNNILAAAKAFANQKQYWTDWATIFNSDFMKQRRGGIMTDVNGAELAASVKGATNPVQAVIKKLLELGFLPTQIGDNIAIATGGATYYRNRINTYLKQGLSQKEAKSKAWTDFQVLAESTQQSARPDMISQQQASPLGKVILAFQNVTSQFNRLGKKAFLDIKNRRISPEYRNASNPQLQSDMSNLSRIAYYFAIQNLIFYSLQSALFMMMFDDNEEDDKFLKKKERMVNGSIDSVLRGSGVWGAVISTLKNMAIKWHEQRDKGWNKDESAVLMEMLNVSPPLGIKARKIVNAEKTLNYNKNVIEEMNTFDIDNPMWSAVTSYTEATTNVPLNRLYNKTQNVRESLDNQHNAFERALMFGGWSKWNLGIGDSEKIKEVKETVKEKKKAASKEKSKIKKEEKEKQIEAENKVKIKENQEKSKKDGICAAVSTSGKRCKKKAIKDGFCTIHEKTEQRKDGKKLQCRKRKDDGTRCKVKTTNKSQYCYYHD